MTGKKDDACGHGSDSAITDELAPMRKWEQGMGSGGYTSGPTHLDRTDFGNSAEAETEAEPSSEEAEPPSNPAAAPSPPVVTPEDDEPFDVGDGRR